MSRYYPKWALKFLWAVCLLIPLASRAEAPRYRYYLDASRAEEILAGLVRPRLYREQWLDIIGGRQNETYQVRKGDTLWGISMKEFGDPFLWRKMWQVNDYLSNPHEIASGQILKYYREGSDSPPEKIIRIPIVRLSPGGASDLDSDTIYSTPLSNRFHPSLIVAKDTDFLGEISGGYTVQETFTELDDVYLDLYNADKVKLGDRFAVARFDRELSNQSDSLGQVVGSLMRLVGEVQIIGLGESLAKAEVRAMSGTMRRGDRLIEIQKAVNWSAVYNPPDNFTCRVVMGDEADRKIFGQADLVLVNKGAEDGMKAGYLFRVFRDMDPRTESTYDVEPDFSGEVQIVYVAPLASIGYIVRNKSPIFIGDTLIANQLFADPPPRPRQEVQTLILD
jgi:hypothetical protein